MPDRKAGLSGIGPYAETIGSGTLSRQKPQPASPTQLRVNGLEILTSRGSPELPHWVPDHVRRNIFEGTLKSGIARFPGKSPWGNIIVWINRGAIYNDVQIYQEYPSHLEFYLDVAKKDDHKARLLHGVYTNYNRDMKYFIEQKRLSPEAARAEIRRINDELFKLVIEASISVMTAGVSIAAISNSLKNFLNNPPIRQWRPAQNAGATITKPIASDWAELSGKLRDMLKQKGNFGREINLGSATREQANAMGKAWVGPNHKVISNEILQSSDGLRQYRLPSFKPKLGNIQANFERRFEGQSSKQWQTNGHIDILDP